MKESEQTKRLRELLDNMLVAEVKRYGGIPYLSKEEMEFREAIAEFLAQTSEPVQLPMINEDPIIELK